LEQQKIEIKEAYKKCCLANLPPEPTDDILPDQKTTIRFRLPNGEILMRKFFATDKLCEIINFATGNGFFSDEYKILSSWPRRDLTNESSEKTLLEMKLVPQETLTIEQR
jgi:FAS-associated factor 1